MFLELVSYCILLWLTAWYLSLLIARKMSKEPPGPVPLPLLGNLIDVSKASLNPNTALAVLADKYGEIYKVQMGTLPTVVLGSVEAMKTIYSREDCAGRDRRGFLNDRALHQNIGMGFASGHSFKSTRPFVMKTLKELGFGRNNLMEITIHEEAGHFMEKLERLLKENNGIFDVNLKFSIHTLNITWIMFTGIRNSSDDEKIGHLLEASDKFARASVFGTGIMVAYPFLRHIFPNLTGFRQQMECNSEIHDLALQLLREYKEVGQYKYGPSNFIEAYLERIEKEEGQPGAVFTEDNFKVTFADLFQGSIETTAAYMECLLLYVTLNPEVQKKVQQEIDDVIGDAADYGMAHHGRMPYTQAVILEAHRHGKTLPQFIPHKVEKDFYYKDYLIKKDTVIIPATEAVNNDKEIFSHPNEFYPEHFLDDQGKLKNLDKMLPFGIGPRRCPGESVAVVIIFIFITTMLRAFTFSPLPNEPLPTTELQLGLTMRPFPYKVVVTKRK